MAENPVPSLIPFDEFLRVCTDSGLITEDTSRRIHGFARAMGGVGSVPRMSGTDSERLQSFENILAFDYPDNMTFDSYITTEENYYTCEILRTVAFIPRIWKAIAPVFIHAPTGQGKTHLLAATRNATSRKALLINTLDLETEFQHALSAGRERELRDWMIQHDLILIDDIQFARGNRSFEKFVISVMNRMPRETHGIVISSDVEPSMLTGMDASLLSRLMSGITIKLEIVSKKGRREILEQFFKYTGMNLSDDVVDYLADTFTTNVRQLKAAARMVLARVLGTGSAMTVESTRALLGFMTERIGTELPEFDEDLPMAPGGRTEYIVVEVEEEPDRRNTGSGLEPFVIEPVSSAASSRRPQTAGSSDTPPKSAARSARAQPARPVEPPNTPAAREDADEDSGHTEEDYLVPMAVSREKPHAPAVERHEEQPLSAWPAGSAQPAPAAQKPVPSKGTAAPAGTPAEAPMTQQQAPAPDDAHEPPRSGRRSAKRFKEMLESADTVEKQTEALRLAVGERIRQLMESGANDIDIGKLQVTLKFLEKGDLESAMLSLKA